MAENDLLKLFRIVERTPGSTLPFEGARLAANIERHLYERPVVKLPRLTVYEYQKQVEDDMAKRSHRMEIRQRLADYMETKVHQAVQLREYLDMAERLRQARVTGALGILEGHYLTAWDDKVNCVRLCPDESREETQRLVKRYGRAIEQMMERDSSLRLVYHVFTIPNAPLGELGQAQKDIYKQYANFHRSKFAKQHIKGSFAMIECPLSARGDWNVHLNVISLVRGVYPYRKVRELWGYNVHIDAITATPEGITKAFCECVKYAAKHIGEKGEDEKHRGGAPGITSWPPEAFHEWYMAGKGFRRSRTYGDLYLTKKKVEALGLRLTDTPIEMDLVDWIGSIRWASNGYAVHLKNGAVDASNGVDSILADNFAKRRERSEPPPRTLGHYSDFHAINRSEVLSHASDRNGPAARK